MSDDYVRLSELAGIDREEGDFVSYWPINAALLILGASILGICFYSLDANDPRLIYNPWEVRGWT